MSPVLAAYLVALGLALILTSGVLLWGKKEIKQVRVSRTSRGNGRRKDRY